MMYWFGTDVGGWGYTLMIISMAAFWGLLITAFVLFTRSENPIGACAGKIAGPAVRPRRDR